MRSHAEKQVALSGVDLREGFDLALPLIVLLEQDCPDQGDDRVLVEENDAWRGEMVRLVGTTVEVPGTRRERLSMDAGNLRIQRLLDRW